jgi:LysR family transcriptional regulator, low CO2-responsive transcriptional regulator
VRRDLAMCLCNDIPNIEKQTYAVNSTFLLLCFSFYLTVNITFRQLQVFVEVVRCGGVSIAATHLHLTPPAVSMQVAELERQLGLKLFNREGRRLRLSTAGEYFLVHARRMLAALRSAEHEMAKLSQVQGGRLVVAMVGTAAVFVPRLLARFREQHRGVELRLRVAANRDALVALLTEGEADLAVMGRAPGELRARTESFATHPMGFVAPPSHPLAQQERVEASLLAEQAFIVREAASGTRAAHDEFFRPHRMEMAQPMELAGNGAVTQAVVAGLGLALLSLHAVDSELRLGRLRVLPVVGTPLMRRWNLVHLLSGTLSPAAEAFRYFVIEHGERIVGELDAWRQSVGSVDTRTG